MKYDYEKLDLPESLEDLEKEIQEVNKYMFHLSERLKILEAHREVYKSAMKYNDMVGKEIKLRAGDVDSASKDESIGTTLLVLLVFVIFIGFLLFYIFS